MPIVWTEEARSKLVARSRGDLKKPPKMGVAEALERLRKQMDPVRKPTYFTFDDKLREPMLLASNDEREEGKRIVRRAWKRASLGQKLTGSWTFFEEEPWVDDTARTWLAHPTTKISIAFLYATIRDFDLLHEVWSHRKQARSYLEILATFGERAVDLLLDTWDNPLPGGMGNGKYGGPDQQQAARALALVDDPRVALRLAKGLRWATTKPAAAEFFARFPHHATKEMPPGVLPIHEEAPPTEAKPGALPPALRKDPRRPDKAMPAAWNPKAFRRPLLKNGTALPIEAIERIGMMLALSTPAKPWPDLAAVKAACDARSLAELSWDCLRAWDLAGRKPGAKWMRDSIVHLADDEVVRRTTPGVKADGVIPALEALQTPAAIMELLTIEHHAKRLKGPYGCHKLRWSAAQALKRIAKQRGCHLDAVVETVPFRTMMRAFDKSLGPDGALTVRGGAHRLRVGFDSHLVAYVTDGEKRLDEIPDDGSPDAKVWRAAWKELQEDVAVLAPRLIAGLERVVQTQRTWTPEAFRTRWLEDPLLRPMVRALVWAQGARTFRVADDGTFADSHDAPMRLGTDPVSIASPKRIPSDERERWCRIIGEYELIPPFPQMA